MPERSCSILMSRSRSALMRSNPLIMLSIWAIVRRLSSTRNFFRRMSVSRDFIDFVLPQAPALIAAKPPRAVAEHLPKNSLLLPYLAVAPLPHESLGVRHGKSRLHAHHLICGGFTVVAWVGGGVNCAPRLARQPPRRRAA